MNEPTRALHIALIRAAKGMIKAWETWLDSFKDAKQESKPT